MFVRSRESGLSLYFWMLRHRSLCTPPSFPLGKDCGPADSRRGWLICKILYTVSPKSILLKCVRVHCMVLPVPREGALSCGFSLHFPVTQSRGHFWCKLRPVWVQSQRRAKGFLGIWFAISQVCWWGVGRSCSLFPSVPLNNRDRFSQGKHQFPPEN